MSVDVGAEEASSAALARSVATLKGVGPARARALAAIGVRTLLDLVCLLPRRASAVAGELTVAAARERAGEEVTIRAKVERVSLQRYGRRSTLRVTLSDGTGSIAAVWFNQPWMRKSFAVGAELELRGRVREAGGVVLLAPRVGSSERPLAAPGTIELAYPSIEGLSGEALARHARDVAERHGDAIEEPLADADLASLGVPRLSDAVRALHAPASVEAFERARARLALEPLLRMQARLHQRRELRASGAAERVEVDAARHRELAARFPFAFTAGQEHVAAELRADLASGAPMRRLLQGDVGSGKTALGAYAALAVAGAGGQTAFLAPTELLAEQHWLGLRDLLAAAGARSVLLTGSLSSPARKAALAEIESGRAAIVFGTHALFSGDVAYARLVLAVIDEQQRFGVAQRARLVEKGEDVHVLLMTATPIPRTLALTLYGDLDTSLLRERPAGRGVVRTRWVRGDDRKRVPRLLAERMEKGEQVYWVAPRIGEGADDGEEHASAEHAHAKLSQSPLARFGVELVHGRLDSDVRAERIARFRRGDVRLLVATTVIEVGVDVPAATVIVIENAERLGLAQLHQLRGRIGRGPRDGWCLLFAKPAASERMLVLERASDGFEIAEEDLRRRGMGDLAGLRQAGENLEGIGELDVHVLLAARDLVARDARVRARYLDPDSREIAP